MVKNGEMNSIRPFCLIVLIGCVVDSAPLEAQSAAAFSFPKQYRTEMDIATKDGRAVVSNIYMDNGKSRTEVPMQGTELVYITRPDQMKMYQLMAQSKTAVEIPLDPAQYKQGLGATAPDAKFEVAGPEKVGDVVYTKFKVTSNDGKVWFLWADMALQVPLKVMSEDGSYVIVWKNFKAGPQDAALFEVPAGYQLMQKPAAGGAGSSGGAK